MSFSAQDPVKAIRDPLQPASRDILRQILASRGQLGTNNGQLYAFGNYLGASDFCFDAL